MRAAGGIATAASGCVLSAVPNAGARGGAGIGVSAADLPVIGHLGAAEERGRSGDARRQRDLRDARRERRGQGRRVDGRAHRIVGRVVGRDVLLGGDTFAGPEELVEDVSALVGPRGLVGLVRRRIGAGHEDAAASGADDLLGLRNGVREVGDLEDVGGVELLRSEQVRARRLVEERRPECVSYLVVASEVQAEQW